MGLASIIFTVVSFKILLIFTYFSTDFEVHRNWLSITHSLPLSKWYTDATSQWTLDYPPFFAWFEWLLSFPAKMVDPGMVRVQSQPYVNFKVLLFQRATVICSDFWLIFASIYCAKNVQKSSRLGGTRSKALFKVTAALLVGNAGLILVDHIHFQYNGFLTGFLLLSVVNVMRDRCLAGAAWYAILVCFKHIYLYLAPAYIAYYLRNYCFTDRSRRFNLRALIGSFHPRRCFRLAGVLLAVFAVCFGPFIYLGQFGTVLARLFPFKRGLTHAYWAPNFWSLYNAADLVSYQAMKKAGFFPVGHNGTAGYTTGLVQEYDHLVLPTVTPLMTLVITVLVAAPFCAVLAVLPRRGDSFLRLLVVCAFVSYMFGWHVHEKAILLVTLPMTILAVTDFRFAKTFVFLSTIGHCSLFPLFFTEFETPIKFGITLVYLLFSIVGLREIFRIKWSKCRIPFLNGLETCYLLGLVGLEIYKTQIHSWIEMEKRFPFLPLLLTSVYCSIGVLYSFCQACWLFLCEELNVDLWWLKRIWTRKQLELKKKLKCVNGEKWEDCLLNGKDMGKLKEMDKLKYVGGVDISTPDGDSLNACVCLSLLSYPDLTVIETVCERVTIDKPYIAGFLAFREAEPIVRLVRKFCKNHSEIMPQVLMIDGNGLLHPRGFGLASHVGVLLDMPTVGVAKDLHLIDGIIREVRRYEEELISPGQTIPLETRDGTVLGCALKPTADAKNPVFVSIGHKIDLPTATALTINCSKYRVPEPIRQADQASRKAVKVWFEN